MSTKTPQVVIKSTPEGIHTEEIPDSAKYLLAKSLWEAINQYFEIPGVREDYQRWKAERGIE